MAIECEVDNPSQILVRIDLTWVINWRGLMYKIPFRVLPWSPFYTGI